MKRRLACLLRRWARRLDPPLGSTPPAAGFYMDLTGIATVSPSPAIPASWTWNDGGTWDASIGAAMAAAGRPDPPSLTVVR